MKIFLKIWLPVFMITAFLSSAAFGAEESYPAPEFKLADLIGAAVTLSSYKDKQPVILFFWTTSCPLCRRQIKVINNVYPELSKAGAEVLAINVGDYAYEVEKFLKYYPLSCRVILDKDTAVARSYGIFGVPTYIMVDKKGNIRFADYYFPEKEYKALLRE